jgi:dTDP-4-dehydrorhamnose reductase
MKKVLLIGSTGMLGGTLGPFLRKCGYLVVTHGKSSKADFTADLTVLYETQSLIKKTNPDVVINLIGLTNVDECESNLQKAFLINSKTVENISDVLLSQNQNSYLIHLSTDQIYDGEGLHSEKDITITNNYAMTKYAGELAALRIPSAVLRTNFIGRSSVEGRESLSDWIYKSCVKKSAISVFEDILFNPLSIESLCEIISLVVNKKPLGVFNLGSHNGMSKADFAFEFAKELDLPINMMKRTKSSDATFLKVYRPKNMIMDVSKFEKELGLSLPELGREIVKVTKDYDYDK